MLNINIQGAVQKPKRKHMIWSTFSMLQTDICVSVWGYILWWLLHMVRLHKTSGEFCSFVLVLFEMNDEEACHSAAVPVRAAPGSCWKQHLAFWSRWTVWLFFGCHSHGHLSTFCPSCFCTNAFNVFVCWMVMIHHWFTIQQWFSPLTGLSVAVEAGGSIRMNVGICFYL